jgi:hypothetical protein
LTLKKNIYSKLTKQKTTTIGATEDSYLNPLVAPDDCFGVLHHIFSTLVHIVVAATLTASTPNDLWP